MRGVGVAPSVHHRPPARQAIRVHPVLDIPAAPALASARWPDTPTRAPGGTAAGPTASPERQDPHGRGVLCEPAAPPGAGGPARRPAGRRAARPWRDTRGRSWPAPPATTARRPVRPALALTMPEQGKLP